MVGLTVAVLCVFMASAPLAQAKDKQEKGAPASDSGAAKDLGVAQKMIRAGNYSQAIPRLLKVLGEAAGSREAIEARYFLGVAYEAIQDLRGAQQQLKEYLELAPDGEYAKDARARLQSVGGELDERYVSPTEIEQKIAAARQRIQEAPDEVGHRLELADMLWSKGDYAEAGKVYAEILGRWPRLQDDMVVRQRMVRGADGAWQALDPQAAVLQAADRDPLLIYNTASFRSGREDGFTRSFQASKYNVTGEAMNRGQSTLNDVELIVTIYGFGGKVFETKSLRVGSMAPGAARPFSVVFENFDSIENIERYDVKGAFTR